jgi:hypothetical protein
MGVFKFEVIKQYMGGDQGDEVETDISIAILATDGTIQKEINYNNPDDWDTWSVHDGSWPVSDVVSPERATVTVRVSINEHDVTGTDHWVRRIKLDNATGAVVTVMDDQNSVLKTGPLTTSCVRESEDPGHGSWGVCWAPVTVTGNLGSPQLCAKVLAEYLDSGYGQTYLEPSGSSRTQEVPASYSYASYRVSSDVKEYIVGDVRVPERTLNASTSGYFALDQNGCVPASLALKGEDMRYDPSGKLEIELRFRSEFCRDTTGNNCPPDENNNELITSGTQYQLTDSDGKIHEWCIILTSDESVTSSECDVIHASQGAFSQWNSISNTNLKYAPLNIPVKPSDQDAMTRTAGVVSTVYTRALESPDIVSAFLLDKTIYKLKTGTFCALQTDIGNGRLAVDSCAEAIGPDFECAPDQSIYDCAWQDATTRKIIYQSCDVASDDNCRPGLDHFKTGLAHEIGHQVQDANGAMLSLNYDLTIPGLPKLCTCDHVLNANRDHCPQSLEIWSTAFIEGYGHYFAAGVMNADSRTSNSCVFLYEKEILDETCRAANGDGDCTDVTIDGKSVKFAKTPIKVNCDTPGLWRNRHCGGAGDIVADDAVELDVMGFLRSVSIKGNDDQRLSNSNLLTVLSGAGAGASVSWEGSTAQGEQSFRQVLLMRLGGDPTETHYAWTKKNADDYGVSKKTN